MRALLDSSVLVAALVQAHPRHPEALPWIERAVAGDFALFVAAHSLAETYAVLTSMPLRPRIDSATGWRLIADNVVAHATIVSLSAPDYRKTLKQLADRSLTGGIVYDGLIAAAARKATVDRLVTLNPKDFERLQRDGDPPVVQP